MFFSKSTGANLPIKQEDHSQIAEWLNYEEPETEGQLAIDVYQTGKKIVIKSTIAGAEPDNIKISLHHDLLTISGSRSGGTETDDHDYLYRECYWGSFSRSIILPAEVDPKKVEAELENGVLTVTLYKSKPEKIEIKFKD